jgi:hypothetical protein
MQVALDPAPTATEYLPDSHEMHVCSLVAVTVVEYFPAGQAVHVCASSGE